MKITIEYAAQIKRAAGIASEVQNIDTDETLENVILKIAEQHGDPLSGLLLTNENSVQPSLLFFVDDVQVNDISQQTLADGSRVTILSPISGG